MDRRAFLIQSLSGLALANLSPGEAIFAAHTGRDSLTRIAFGSCCRQGTDQSIWRVIAAEAPDLFIHLGDTVYTDPAIEARDGVLLALDRVYAAQARNPDFAVFASHIPILHTWDDHDFGAQDGGRDFALRDEARRRYLDFWHVPADDPRRSQPDGVYYAREIGSGDRCVQIILLDCRFNRSALLAAAPATEATRRQLGLGPYRPNRDPVAAMLGEAQWTWLAAQLRRPARLRLIGSSIQFGAGFRGWDSWENFPLEKARLSRLIAETGAQGVAFVSGDIHYGEFSVETRGAPYPLWDFTSSGLTHYWPSPGPNMNRWPRHTYHGENFGLLDIDWSSGTLQARILDKAGKVQLCHTVALADLNGS